MLPVSSFTWIGMLLRNQRRYSTHPTSATTRQNAPVSMRTAKYHLSLIISIWCLKEFAPCWIWHHVVPSPGCVKFTVLTPGLVNEEDYFLIICRFWLTLLLCRKDEATWDREDPCLESFITKGQLQNTKASNWRTHTTKDISRHRKNTSLNYARYKCECDVI